jgi:hypothetical protein
MATTHFDEFDPETVDQGGMAKPGRCQLLVAAVEENEEGERPYVSVTHEIAAHEDPTQNGKVSYNSFSLTGKAARRALLFALATGLVTKQALAEAKAQGTSVDIDYTKAYGAVYFCTLEESEYNGKKKCRAEWDFKTLNDPEAAEYPCSPDYPRTLAAKTEPAAKPAQAAKTTTVKKTTNAKAKPATVAPSSTVNDTIPF